MTKWLLISLHLISFFAGAYGQSESIIRFDKSSYLYFNGTKSSKIDGSGKFQDDSGINNLQNSNYILRYSKSLSTSFVDYTSYFYLIKYIVDKPFASGYKKSTREQIVASDLLVGNAVSAEISDSAIFSIDSSSYYYFRHLSPYISGRIFRVDSASYTRALRSFGVPAKYLTSKPTTKDSSQNGEIVITRTIAIPDWFLIVYLASLVLLIIVQFYNPKYVSYLFLAVFNFNSFIRYSKERNSLNSRAGFFLFVHFYINVALTILLTFKLLEVPLSYGIFTINFAFILAILLVGYLIKRLSVFLLSYTFNILSINNLRNKNIYLIYQLVGVILLPFNFILSYLPSLHSNVIIIYSIYWVMFGFYFFHFIRLFKIIFQKHFSLFYLFLYLCGVELLPILVLIKYYATMH